MIKGCWEFWDGAFPQPVKLFVRQCLTLNQRVTLRCGRGGAFVTLPPHPRPQKRDCDESIRQQLPDGAETESRSHG